MNETSTGSCDRNRAFGETHDRESWKKKEAEMLGNEVLKIQVPDKLLIA